MQAVVLAAGDGGRLGALTRTTPKPLLPVRGLPLLAHVLAALSRGGVRDATIVAGYRAQQVRDAAATLAPFGMRVRVVTNDAHQLGNARSLWASANAVVGPFVLAMADHIVDPAMVRAVGAGPARRCRLAVDVVPPADPRAAEATRARVEHGMVRELGKQLKDWNALDTGLFWCTPRIFDELQSPALRDGELSAVFAALARRNELEAADVTGMPWFDIDTREDLVRAELLGASAQPTEPPAEPQETGGRVA